MFISEHLRIIFPKREWESHLHKNLKFGLNTLASMYKLGIWWILKVNKILYSVEIKENSNYTHHSLI